MSIVVPEKMKGQDKKQMLIRVPPDLYAEFAAFCALRGSSITSRVVYLMRKDIHKWRKIVNSTTENQNLRRGGGSVRRKIHWSEKKQVLMKISPELHAKFKAAIRFMYGEVTITDRICWLMRRDVHRWRKNTEDIE